MNSEIKEILDNFKIYEDRYKKCNENQFIIFYRDIHLLLDYITNLQEEKDSIDDYTRHLHNENKSLQEENDRLKELCDRYEEEHSTTFEYWKHLIKEDYKSRNEKAIKYIEKSMNNPQPFYEYLFGDENGKVENLDKLLNILNGGDE